MNVTEANAVNKVLAFCLGDIDVEYDEARDAAMFLADRAHEALSAGLTGADVEELWGDDYELDPPRAVEDVVSELLVDPAGAHSPSQYRHPPVDPAQRPSYERLTDGQHRHRFQGQSLVHHHADGHRPHGYFEHPEDIGAPRSNERRTS